MIRTPRIGVLLAAGMLSRAGTAHELFVWDDVWVSHDMKRLEADGSIRFDDVPAGRLYWLVAQGSRRIERIVTVEGTTVRRW